jgi:hypothetical protein
VTAVIVVLAGAVAGGVVWGKAHHASWLGYKPATSSPSASSSPHPTPTHLVINRIAPSGLSGPPPDPFAGSPADPWADGAAGIPIPAAKAHGPYTAAQVHAAYVSVRDMLVAGNLDWPTLRGGYPAAYAKLLPRQERAFFTGNLNKRGTSKDGAVLSTRDWVASFAPGTTRFVTSVVKVEGTMSASEATDSSGRVLRITVDYLFTYAVEPPGSPADWMRVVDQESGYFDLAQWDDPAGPLEPWAFTGTSHAGVICGTTDGYIHPDYPNNRGQGIQPSGPPVNPYSTATPSPSDHNNCQPTTGT